MKILILLIAACSSMFADSYFTAVYEASPSGAAVATSLQHPVAPLKSARLLAIQVYASVATTFEFEVGGTATTTESTAISHVPRGQTTRPTLRFFTASNASDNSTNINKVVLAAGDTKTIKFDRDAGVFAKGPNANYTVRTNSITGDVKVTWFWLEE